MAVCLKTPAGKPSLTEKKKPLTGRHLSLFIRIGQHGIFNADRGKEFKKDKICFPFEH